MSATRWLPFIGVAFALVGCGGSHPAMTIKGQVVLSKPTGIADPVSYFIAHDASGCRGTASHPELTEGAQVTIHDPANKVIALGQLSAGRWDGTRCTFGFSIPKVPSEPIYGIDVADTGDVQFTRAQVAADQVAVGFS